MLKSAFILFLGLLVFQGAAAQKTATEKDTILYYMKNSGEIVSNKDSADYLMFNMPIDPSSGTQLYPVIELYPNGKRKLTGTASNRSAKLSLQGSSMSFYPNGKRKSVNTYKDGYKIGNVITYYPNGQLYTVEKYNDENKLLSYQLFLMECRDSTGKVLAENGNGEWLKFDEDFKNITEKGPIINGVKDGEWHGTTKDVSKFDCLYKKGESVSGVGYDMLGQAHPFTKDMVQPDYKGGMDEFYEFLRHNIHFPAYERERNITGRVIIQFTIKNNGKLSDVHVVRSISKGIDEEALRVINLTQEWIPGVQYGVPADVKYTVPINFSLGVSR